MIVLAMKQFKKRGIAFDTVRLCDNTANELLITVNLASHLNKVEDAQAAVTQIRRILRTLAPAWLAQEAE
jgi:hypothetical protein